MRLAEMAETAAAWARARRKACANAAAGRPCGADGVLGECASRECPALAMRPAQDIPPGLFSACLRASAAALLAANPREGREAFAARLAACVAAEIAPQLKSLTDA